MNEGQQFAYMEPRTYSLVVKNETHGICDYERE